ncbi:putative heparinase superfamily protein [Azospirillum fermentarium]|uniref:heparinase II/III family protein n=1 Tax=Azospirillum fermentarium TaxID=1233114 RepID=UPI0022270486|nr:heparinase II/III family protein [Azospirillum fermentarium]MCW2244927.1 putative heparinase superfamily protein [Azospirillum fermentarium]
MSGSRDKPGRFRQGMAQLAYGNPLYSMMLGGKAPTTLAVIPSDPWAGDADAGQAILAGSFRFGGQTVTLGPSGEVAWKAPGGNPAWVAGMHGFDWLRDLRAVGGDAARRQARRLVMAWMHEHAAWSAQAWNPAILGTRVSNWLALHDFFCASADDEFRARIFDSLARQTRHLARVLPGKLDGAALLSALKGMIYGGLCLPGAEKLGAEGLRQLDRELARQILPDGGHLERNPSVHLRILRDLIDIRTLLRTARLDPPEGLQPAIDRMTPALRFFRHGDGGLALFNGSHEEDPALIDSVLAQAEARGRPLKSAPHVGYERLMAGRTLVLMDTGTPPAPGLDTASHAGTLALEVSVGKERLIVNCGSHVSGSGPWRSALAATAAHSTVTLAETNSAEVQPEGGLGRRPSHVSCERQEAEGAVLVVANHNGYARAFGYLHRRRVYLAENGEDVRGEDTLEPVLGATPEPQNFLCRFHLHPKVQAAVAQNGLSALLTLPSGAVWRLQASGGVLEATESVYLGGGDEPQRTWQIAITGHTDSKGATVKWALRREHKGG